MARGERAQQSGAPVHPFHVGGVAASPDSVDVLLARARQAVHDIEAPTRCLGGLGREPFQAQRLPASRHGKGLDSYAVGRRPAGLTAEDGHVDVAGRQLGHEVPSGGLDPAGLRPKTLDHDRDAHLARVADSQAFSEQRVARAEVHG